MEQVGEKSARKSALENRRKADARAVALLPIVQKLTAAGFVSHRALTSALNREGIPSAAGGKWHRNSVLRMLRRLELLNGDGISNGLGNKRAADTRAERLAPTVRKLRKAGFISIKAIAGELNERGIEAPRGGKWHLTTVTRLLERLDRLDRASNGKHRR